MKTPKSASKNQTPWLSTRAGTSSSPTPPMTASPSSTQNANTCASSAKKARQRPVQGHRRHRHQRIRGPVRQRLREQPHRGVRTIRGIPAQLRLIDLRLRAAPVARSDRDRLRRQRLGAEHLRGLEGGRIVEFSSSGTLISKFGSSGSGEGKIASAYGLAISGGHIYVSEHANSRVQEFSTKGEYLGSFDPIGSGTGKSNEPWGIASDSSGNLYVSELGATACRSSAPPGPSSPPSALKARARAASEPQGHSRGSTGQGLHRRQPATTASRNGRRDHRPPTRPRSPAMKTPRSSSQNQTPWLSIRAGTSSSPTRAMTASSSSTQNANTCGSSAKKARARASSRASAASQPTPPETCTSATPATTAWRSSGPPGNTCAASAPRSPPVGSCIYPGAIAIDSEGNVWVLNAYGAPTAGASSSSHPTGSLISKFGSIGLGEGQLVTGLRPGLLRRAHLRL